MQFVVFIELIGTVVLPAAIAFTLYVGKYSHMQPAWLSQLLTLFF
jgi:chitin synthase